ncbi:MAG: acyl-CoA thioesterase [Thermodesulfobacteria bacterium]|nr:acyl-CoA thioesterase [Thermodesulfobacteriota bacterium]
MKYRTYYRVIYGDTDCGGVVYHGTYLRLFEIARTEFIREYATPYSEVEKKYQIYLPVVEAFLKYRAPAHYDDLLTLEAFIKEVKPLKIVFGYNILKDEKLLVEGYTVHIAINKQGKAVHLPKKVYETLLRLWKED